MGGGPPRAGRRRRGRLGRGRPSASAFGHYPWETGHHLYPIRVWDAAADGAEGWLDTTTPIDTGRFPGAVADVELVFTFLLAALAWLLIVGRRPLLAVGVGFAAFAVPSTMVAMDGGFVRSLLFLVLAALTLAACGPRALPRAARPCCRSSRSGAARSRPR